MNPLAAVVVILLSGICNSAIGTANLQQQRPTIPVQPAMAGSDADAQANEFARSLVLLLLPATFEDDDEWGKETRIQSGLHMRMDGIQLRTKRKWEFVNHGSWTRGSGYLVEPAKHFQLTLTALPKEKGSVSKYQLKVRSRIRATGQQQQWNYGVMLWSVSAEAEAEISMDCLVEVEQQVIKDADSTRFRFHPQVTFAKVQLERFRLHRISHMKGSAVREVGSWFEGLIRRKIAKENRQLVDRINKKLDKHSEKLEVPIWFGKLHELGDSKQ